MKVLGIDLGDARTGVAISDEMKFIAQSHGTIYNKDTVTKWTKKLKKIIDKRNKI